MPGTTRSFTSDVIRAVPDCSQTFKTAARAPCMMGA